MKAFLALLPVGLLAMASAHAAPVSSFGNLVSGWNVGMGQPNGGFAISTNGSPEVQLGLRSQDYQVGISSNNGSDTYYVQAGERSPGTGYAKWNLDLSAYTHVRAWLTRVEALPGFVPFQKTAVGLAA